MEELVLEYDTVFYVLFAAILWLLGRVVMLIEKTTRSITRLSTAVDHVEKEIEDHETRLRDIERKKHAKMA